MKYNKLKGKIVEKYGTQKKFAQAINEYNSSVSGKLTGRIGFTRADILKWSKALDISTEDIGTFYFAE